MFPDLLQVSLTYPDATPERALGTGVALAERLDGHLTVLTVRIQIPDVGNALANALLKFDRLAAYEERRSAARAEREERAVTIAAKHAGASVTVSSIDATLYLESEAIVAAARTRDICLLSIGPAVLADRNLAEAVLFGSGRPVLVFPEELKLPAAERFQSVTIAWDGSAPAARAVAEAMPILKGAERVRVFLAVGEKASVRCGLAAELARHLQAHAVEAEVVEAPCEGRKIGEVLREHLEAVRADLLVMGGFGHNRLHEFILGGATDSILEAPPCPVLLSH